MNRFIIAIIICVVPFQLCAQVKASPVKKTGNCSCGFQSILQGGLVEGSNGPALILQSINGISYKSWFLGMGVGLDYYSLRTIPLFIEARKDLFDKRRTPFLYVDGGIHSDWLRKKDKPEWGSSEFNRGFYYDAGAGYKLDFGKRDALLLSIGYSMKQMKEERVFSLLCPQPPCGGAMDYYNYTFRRLSFKVGWLFQ